ncbi:hypothetical protein [Streptomyces tsukubensis]|uniref:hypothetical protein n=1 Tax=Streptomyces tsukubensis TaxID=83656 RepID=UPI00344F27EA
MHDRHDETAGSDPLMAVLMGEPVREGDAAAESAERDMALLGEQLKLIGDTLARDAESPQEAGPEQPGGRGPGRSGPERVPVVAAGRRRRRRPLFVLAASVAALASLAGAFTLVQYYVAHPPTLSASDSAKSAPRAGDGRGEGSMRLGPGELVACSALIVEGTVARAERGPAAWLTVTLDIDTRLKPEGGPGRERFRLPADAAGEITVGARMLVVVSRFDRDGEPGHYYVGDRIPAGRDWVDQGLEAAQGLDCP